KSAPTKSAPVETAPTNSVPTKSVPVGAAPARSGPAPVAPAKAAEAVPVVSVPDETAPAEAAPVDIVSVEAPAAPVAPITLQQVRDAWPEILEAVENAKRTAWMVVFTAKPLELREGNVLVLSFQSQVDVDALKQQATSGDGAGDYLKKAVFDILGFTPKLLARVEVTRAAAQEAPEPTEPEFEPTPPSGTTWETAVVTDSEPETKPVRAERPKAERPTADKVPAAASPSIATDTAAVTTIPEQQLPPAQKQAPRQQEKPAYDKQRYGESVVREILGASFIEEQSVAPRVTPREG
ncbi:MAG: polymerase subunit gamma/tau, partial [Microbacteriaceae bacterium]|nr:polymerase subunit gamma/tau [Microbacteriaceae bacterium]